MLNEYLKKILSSRVYDVAEETPVHTATFLSERLENQIWIKREDKQPVYSFKIRGAYNKVVQLTDEEKARGVIAASAGNHAQGLALAAKELGIKAVIVMPRTTPEIKVKSVKARGARVILHGDAFDEAFQYSQKLVEEKGYTYIHPYDDPETIAGQGIANPTALMVSVAMLLEWLGAGHGRDDLSAAAAAFNAAVDAVLADPANHTPDLGGSAKTADIGRAVADAISK